MDDPKEGFQPRNPEMADGNLFLAAGNLFSEARKPFSGTVTVNTPDLSLVAFQRYLLGVKSPTTAKRYAEYAAKFLRLMQESGYSSFSQLPPGLLAEFGSALSRQGASASTVRVNVFAVKKYLEWVKAQGVEVSTQTKPELPKREIRHRGVLPADRFQQFFRQADLELQEPFRTAVMLLPCCGLRGHELVSMKLESIHRGSIKLQKGGEKSTLYLRLVGKGGRERNVPLMEEGVEILTGFLSGWRRRQKGPWLFPQRDDMLGNSHISDRSLRSSVQKLRETLHLEFTPHTMRRTYITLLWRRGVDLGTIAKIAGHASVQTTLDHYIVMEPTDALQALHNAGGSLTE